MKFDPDCARAVMLALESQLVAESNGDIVPYCSSELLDLPELKKYSEDEIFYTLKILQDGGYIRMIPGYDEDRTGWFKENYGITYKGHEFIESVRPHSLWKSVLETIRKEGAAATLDIVVDLAKAFSKKLLSERDEP